MIISDTIREYLIANQTTDYDGAAIWEEDRHPFNNDSSKILFIRQTGISVDAFVRQFGLEIFMFSPSGADGADWESVRDDAESALLYLQQNFFPDEDIRLTISQDVTGPFRTNQERIYYQFAIQTFSEGSP